MSTEKVLTSTWADWMAVFWVQQFFTLPIIFEDFGMGDELPHHRRQVPILKDLDTHEQQDQAPDQHLASAQAEVSSEQSNMEFDSYRAQSIGMASVAGASPLNMGQIASALPDYRASGYGTHHYQQGFALPTNPIPSQMYQYQQSPQFAGQTRPHYDATFAQQFPDHLLQGQPPRPAPQTYPLPSGYQTNYPQGQHFPQSYYQSQQQPTQSYAGPYAPVNYTTLNPNIAPYGQTYRARGGTSQPAPQTRAGGIYYYAPGMQNPGDSFMPASVPGGSPYAQTSGQSLTRHSSDSSLRQSIPRGPPRKPKQSGHALWVGNLPPGTYVADLKDHFSREATKDIESVFLISKSNCAFVNYKSEVACAAAMTRFHDSRFQGVRLVCRLRRGSTATLSANTAGSSSGAPSADIIPPLATAGGEITQQDTETEVTGDGTTNEEIQPQVTKVKERFFVVKSLTVEDLDLSVRNGIWATQAHNEAALNEAYGTAETVYLIFSANKSGEYFGYARMISSIDDESVAPIEPPIRVGPTVVGPADMPATIPTPATETAPKGHIIDDSARGTIFWEADIDPADEETANEEAGTARVSESEDPDRLSPAESQSFGKPFKVVWVSTERLPFYRTRGLRNPWNANREVKIARDGTELEPSVGRRLVGMFHRPQGPPSPVHSRGQPSQGPNYNTGGIYGPQPPAARPY